MEDRKFEIENGWNQTRQLWALIASGLSGKSWRPTDLITLSFDDTSNLKEQLTPEMIKELGDRLKQRFGATIKKNGK